MKTLLLLLVALLIAGCGSEEVPTPVAAPMFTVVAATPTAAPPTALPAPTATLLSAVTPIVTPLAAVEATVVPVILVPTEAPLATAVVVQPTQPAVSFPTPQGPTTNDVANVRSGPGTDFAVVGSVAAGQSITVVGRNAAGDWYQLGDGAWVAAFLVSDAPVDVAVVDVPVAVEAPAVVEAPVVEQPTVAPIAPVAPLAPAATDTPFVVITQPAGAVCDCSGDNYKCDDFGNHASAQACHDYCMSTTGRDVHRLDQDGNGNACESLK